MAYDSWVYSEYLIIRICYLANNDVSTSGQGSLKYLPCSKCIASTENIGRYGAILYPRLTSSYR